MKARRVLGWGVLAVLLALVAAFFVAYWQSDNVCPDPNVAPLGEHMKAIVYCDYGSAEVLRYQDIPKPTLAEDEILVRVRAAGVNPLDSHYMRGTPYIMRMTTGLRKPVITRLGTDFAGTVEAVGSRVTRFKPGDEVFGGRTGAFAEYLTVRQDRSVVLKPANLDFDQAGAVAIAAITALQGLRDKGKLQPGQKVLINGASGGVGTFAVQIAKALGAEVTGVCSTRNVELVRSLGADHVIDYTKENFTEGDRQYDLILDMVGNHPLLALRRVMPPEGTMVIVGGPKTGKLLGPMIQPLKAMIISPFVDQEFSMLLAEFNQKDMEFLRELMESGQVTPVIDRRYSLSEVPEAIRYLEQGRARGKVVITAE
jgi:NADPH:quinone reductase-like Zn-dependent oxidoreductase